MIIDVFIYFFKSIKTEFSGFERLFKRYLTDVNAEIKWQNIEPLPKESVS